MAQAIVPRDLDVDFSQVPRHWMAGSAVATAISNGVNMLFPHGERFFVRSVKHFLDRIDDPELRAQVKGFFGQEGRHAHAHDEFNDILRHQGYEIDQFLDSYKRLSSWLWYSATVAGSRSGKEPSAQNFSNDLRLLTRRISCATWS